MHLHILISIHILYIWIVKTLHAFESGLHRLQLWELFLRRSGRFGLSLAERLQFRFTQRAVGVYSWSWQAPGFRHGDTKGRRFFLLQLNGWIPMMPMKLLITYGTIYRGSSQDVNDTRRDTPLHLMASFYHVRPVPGHTHRFICRIDISINVVLLEKRPLQDCLGACSNGQNAHCRT